MKEPAAEFDGVVSDVRPAGFFDVTLDGNRHTVLAHRRQDGQEQDQGRAGR